MSLIDSFKNAISTGDGDGRDLGFGKVDAEFMLSDKKDIKITTNVDKLSDVDVKYPLIKPFAYAHVTWDEEEKALIYSVIEPELEEEDRQLLDTIKENLSEKIDVSLSSMQGREKILGYLQDQINDLLIELGLDLSKEQHNKILYYVYRDFVGLGKVEPFMHDPYIEDLGCDGTGTPIFAVHSEFGSVKSDVVFNDSETLENLVIKLAERCGRYVSYANPLLDGALPDGSRVNASLTEDVTSNGPTFSIRKFQDTPFSAVDMMSLGTASADIMAFLWLCQQYKQNILVCGGTATGK
ncbi:MAG: type II/IV secretion system ATPase subunit, partial [Candidatus Nanohaloarchaea archaeon]